MNLQDLAFTMVLRILIFSCFMLAVNVGSADPIPANSKLSEFQQRVIHYFKEVALGYEYGTASEITRKWTKPMNVFIDGAHSDEVDVEVEKVVSELNDLITNDFEIRIVTDKSIANLHLYVGSLSSYTALYPQDYDLAKANSGIFTVTWNKNQEIVRGRIFIKNTISTAEQRHAVREELTQSLGFGRDSMLYRDSIFQLKYTTLTEYAEIDREVIRLLYHPQMRSGLSASEVDHLLTEILLAEKDVFEAMR
jgi:hypothetical protein